MSTILAKLPTEMREELKEPLGEIYTDPKTLLAEAGEPIVAVGDIVTYHLLEAERRPDVAIVDRKTKRTRVGPEVLNAIETFEDRIDVANPQSTITDDLLEAISSAIDRSEPTVIVVDGEEDLAVLPVIVLAPDGASVVYGQPGEGMVHVRVGGAVRDDVRSLLERFEGDGEALFTDGDR